MLTRVSIWTFPSFNLSVFTEEDGTAINNEDKILNKKMLKLAQFCNFKADLGKISFLKIAAQALRLEMFLTFS